jgi:hypothetical protein
MSAEAIRLIYCCLHQIPVFGCVVVLNLEGINNCSGICTGVEGVEDEVLDPVVLDN